MIIQIINLSPVEVFKQYSEMYGINRDEHQQGITGLEIRSIPRRLSQEVQDIVLKGELNSYIQGTKGGEINLIILASIKGLKELSQRILSLGNQEFCYNINNVINNYKDYDLNKYLIGKKEFNFNNAYVMGILNVTPDSFSDGGLYYDKDLAVNHAINMIDLGADIIDIGGESTRPGSEVVSAKEEIKRVIPVLEKIISEKPDAIISIDTNKKIVAEMALGIGAKIINDISGLTFDSEIADVVKKYNALLVIMHMKGTPKNMQLNPSYNNVIKEIYDFFYERIAFAKTRGIEKLFIDPGIGFGKRIEDNFEIIRRLGDFKSLGIPLMIGISRKSFLGKALNLEVNLRDTATTIAESISIKNGARIIRTHNVNYGVQVCKLLNYLN
ncbi:MAG: dihydropteroate synthase [Ignavibacteriaceae bacterium]